MCAGGREFAAWVSAWHQLATMVSRASITTTFTTGLHPDYHRITDTVDKIQFPKMTRIAQLVYEVGFSIANSEKPLERDNKGSRTGFGSKAEILAK